MKKVTVRRLNMSNQFYNYLAEKLFSYFKDNIITGEKYYINFEDVYYSDDSTQHEESPVIDLYDCLKNLGNSEGRLEKFKYKHDNGNKVYKTFYLNFKNVKLIVVDNIRAKNSYISLLRNLVKDQIDEWENSALLIISQKANDTISQGTSNLRKEGKPLSVSAISSNLRHEIEFSSLNFQYKNLLLFCLDELNKESSKNIWHYKSILSIVKKEDVDESDLCNLSLFPDSNLSNYRTESDIRDRLIENRKLFLKIPWLKLDADKRKLKREFDDNGVELLDSDTWYESDYSLLLRSINSNKESKDPLEYDFSADKEINGELVCWDVPSSKTSVGKRTRSIIIFNDKKIENISLKLNFNKHTSGKYIHNSCKSFVSAPPGKKLLVNIEADLNKTVFKKIIYTPKDDEGVEINSQKHSFRIAIINSNENLFTSMKEHFKITGSNDILISVDNLKDTELIFGNDSENYEDIIIEEETENIVLSQNESIRISEDSDWDDNSLYFNIIYSNSKIPLKIKKKTKDFPKHSSFIWNKKREEETNFIFDGTKVTQGSKKYAIVDEFKKYLNFEREIISNKVIFGRFINDKIYKEDIDISDELLQAYDDIFDYFDKINNTPSLVYINEELKRLYSNLINIFNDEVDTIVETSLSENDKKLNLINIGRIEGENEIMYSSLSPINIVYQLEILNKVGNEPFESNIYEKLTPRNLIPYIYSNSNKLFKPIFHRIQEWLIYKEEKKVSIGTSSQYTHNTINKMLNEFENHFSYLFINQNINKINIFDDMENPSIKINVIDINDDSGIVEGIFYFISEKLEKTEDTNNLISVKLNIYNNTETTEFDKFFKCKTKEELFEEFEIEVNDIGSYDSFDIIRIVQNNIKYSVHPFNSEYEYAHISFYKVTVNSNFDHDNDVIFYDHDKLETGLYLNGLLSSITSTNSNSTYRTGFGTKNILNLNNTLIKTAINLNILAENSKKNGENTFSRENSIVTKLNLQSDKLDKIYDNSRWVTFIDPNFGIEYFEDSSGEIILVHYSDQYTSSDKYDTITVTKKVDHYSDLIKEFLNPIKWEMDPNSLPDDLTHILRLFNCINGEWLLDIISNTSEHNPEKLSFISAIKYCLAILDHEDIVWIPVSMEELLRISGSYKLAKSEGFISKMKEKTGEHSDDLLFIGLKFNEGDIKLIFFPVEVKVGYNYANIIDKGENQLIAANNFLKEILSKDTEHEFRNKVFRNYFIQRFLSNTQNFILNSLWPEKNFNKVDKFKAKLLNDDFKVSWDFENYIGKGYLISFQKDLVQTSIEEKNDIFIVNLPKSFVYTGLADSIEEIRNNVHSESSEFKKDFFLKNKL